MATTTGLVVQRSVLLVGGTGRTGSRVLSQLLERGVPVRVIVRSAARLSVGVRAHHKLTIVEADVLRLSAEDLRGHLTGCDTVISCLGHTLSLKGIFGPPFDLVTRTVSNLAAVVPSLKPVAPVRFILMSSESVHQPGTRERAHGWGQRFVVGMIHALIPPARDNQRAADVLSRRCGPGQSWIEWVVVRPDTLREGGVTPYVLHDALVSSIFHPDETNMSNVAHFMCELACDERAWTRWQGRMPVIVNAKTTA